VVRPAREAAIEARGYGLSLGFFVLAWFADGLKSRRRDAALRGLSDLDGGRARARRVVALLPRDSPSCRWPRASWCGRSIRPAPRLGPWLAFTWRQALATLPLARSRGLHGANAGDVLGARRRRDTWHDTYRRSSRARGIAPTSIDVSLAIGIIAVLELAAASSAATGPAGWLRTRRRRLPETVASAGRSASCSDQFVGTYVDRLRALHGGGSGALRALAGLSA
jgi:hypothetical protein